jgi:hypothetical protein
MTTQCNATRHGTLTAYTVDGCRCPDAVETKRAYAREWAANRRACGTTAARGVDELAVDLAVAGHPMALRPVERTAAVAQLDRYDLKDWQRAERLGVSRRTILRHRAARRNQQAA